ncbi:hypothetical protein O0L34_g18466 [Tuta absoluta]|nr:hypothetical protein O0L34_g18466 [Tuta absoluta]
MAKFSLMKLEEVMQKCLAPVLHEVTLLREVIEKLEHKISAIESLQNTSMAASSSSASQQQVQKDNGTSLPIINQQQPQQTNVNSAVDKIQCSRELRPNTRRQLKNTANPAQHQAAHAQAKTPKPSTPKTVPDAPTKGDGRRGSDEIERTTTARKLAFNEDKSLTCEGEWQEVRRNKKRTKNTEVIVGTSNVACDLQSVEKLTYISAWSFKPDTTEDQLRNYLNTVESSSEYVVEKRTIKSNVHAAFIIGMPENLYPRLVSPTSWPQGVRIANWSRFRGVPRAERGNPKSQ